jgi:excisionase family DNA binding protein
MRQRSGMSPERDELRKRNRVDATYAALVSAIRAKFELLRPMRLRLAVALIGFPLLLGTRNIVLLVVTAVFFGEAIWRLAGAPGRRHVSRDVGARKVPIPRLVLSFTVSGGFLVFSTAAFIYLFVVGDWFWGMLMLVVASLSIYVIVGEIKWIRSPVSRASADDLLTMKEVAALLGVRPDWVYTLVARNQIPSVREGSRWRATTYRFRRSEIEAWMAANEEPATPKPRGS